MGTGVFRITINYCIVTTSRRRNKNKRENFAPNKHGRQKADWGREIKVGAEMRGGEGERQHVGVKMGGGKVGDKMGGVISRNYPPSRAKW